MNTRVPIRYADLLCYDRERGVLLALDQRAFPQPAGFVTYDDAESIARAIETIAAERWAAPYLAGFGLALVARAWAGRPTDARRGAIIQAGERLRGARPHDQRLARLIEQGLARADAALLAGADAEAALADFVGTEISRADRAVERCGRLAAGLLDESDRVLTRGFAGPALGWLLHYALAEQKPIVLLVAAPRPNDQEARQTAELARAIGAAAELLDDSALARAEPTVLVVAAEQIALDGSIGGAAGERSVVELAQRHGWPRYIFAPEGPDPDLKTVADIAAVIEATPPQLISAIITSRGIYRPEMIARYLGDGEAPLDVIPLSLN